MIPEVSIGLPVFNGEKYIRQSLDSLLSQTFEDFELVICDNCSTDGTEQICRDYRRHDRRIRYYRNDSNIGAAGNFNHAFELTRGQFFKWAAHDDLCAPSYLSCCVQAMRKHPEVSLCQSDVVFVDENGRPFGRWPCTAETDHARPSRRLRAVLGNMMCLEIFGLIRRKAMGALPVMGSYTHGDGVLLGKLALAGPFYRVSEPLFFSRRHADQSGSVNKDAWEWASWFDPNNNGYLVMPYWRIYSEYLKVIRRSRLTLREMILCFGCWVHSAASDRKRLCRDIWVAAGRSLGRHRRTSPGPQTSPCGSNDTDGPSPKKRHCRRNTDHHEVDASQPLPGVHVYTMERTHT